MTMHDWIVRLYNEKNEIIEKWIIKERTARHAEKEAMSEIERHYPNINDWTLTKKEN